MTRAGPSRTRRFATSCTPVWVARRVRVRLSNAFGFMPLRIGAAQGGGPPRRRGHLSGQPGRRLTFSGQSSIQIPAGAVAVSDAVDLDVPGAGDLAVSVYLPEQDRAGDVSRSRPCRSPT